MVTPEMLLFLAGKMGHDFVQQERSTGRFWIEGGVEFNPATDDAQFGRLVVWAAMQGLYPNFGTKWVECCEHDTGLSMSEVDHDSTPDSIRAAAVVAVCRALGFDAAMEADK